jgi:hypothetical protein
MSGNRRPIASTSPNVHSNDLAASSLSLPILVHFTLPPHSSDTRICRSFALGLSVSSNTCSLVSAHKCYFPSGMAKLTPDSGLSRFSI